MVLGFDDARKRSYRFQRLFMRLAAVVLATIAALTVVHFVLGAGGLGWVATNLLFVAGLLIAAFVLIISVRLAGRAAERSVADLHASYLASIRTLIGALDARDGYTGDHAATVREQTLATGRALGMSESDLDALGYAALFHDIGKIGIPDSILHKEGPLDEAEWEVMKRHPQIGVQILAPLDFISPILPIVCHEHERWDGGGYPDGLAGEEIPLGSRVILVCDAFHAMTSDRPYRKALSEGEAIRRLREAAGTQFDPRVVEVFLKRVLQPGPAANGDEPRTVPLDWTAPALRG